MTNIEKEVFLSEKYGVSYHYALAILKQNWYDLQDAINYFEDMEQGNDSTICIKHYQRD